MNDCTHVVPPSFEYDSSYLVRIRLDVGPHGPHRDRPVTHGVVPTDQHDSAVLELTDIRRQRSARYATDTMRSRRSVNIPSRTIRAPSV